MTVHHDHRGYRPAPGPSVSDRLSPFWRWLSEVMWRLEHGFERAKADARPEEDTRVRIFLVLIVFSVVFGALALGAALGTVAVIIRQEIVLVIMGGVFVVETLSVMLQVTWFKYTKKKYGEGRRILRMAPLHHHFEQSGWKETQVVVRFWIITIMLVLIGLSTLKLR